MMQKLKQRGNMTTDMVDSWSFNLKAPGFPEVQEVLCSIGSAPIK